MKHLPDRLITRAEFAFELARADAKKHGLLIIAPHRGILHLPGGLPIPKRDLVEDLIVNNRDVYDKLINHPYPQSLADATASLDGFRFYMIQDKLYLENYVRERMVSVAQSSSTSFGEVEAFALHLPTAVKYSQIMNDICAYQLGVSQEVIDNTHSCSAMNNSRDFYQKIAKDDDWFTMHIALLPCIMGYWQIASKLLANPSTVRNVMYHKLWTIGNADQSFIDAYRYFINANLPAESTQDTQQRWTDIFRNACQLETKFFDVAQALNTAFHIIPDSTYFIRSFVDGRVLDNARQNVEAVKKTGSDTEKWRATATLKGYTFQNVRTGLYLGIDIVFEPGKFRVRALQEPYYWWINPVPSMPEQKTFQVFDTKSMKFALQIDMDTFSLPNPIDVDGTLPPEISTSVVVRNNSGASDQMWLFEYAEDEQGL